MKNSVYLAAAAAITFTSGPAFAQTSTSQQTTARDRIEAIFGTLFGDRRAATATLEAQWDAGQAPLTNQRSQFDTRVDTEVRSGSLGQATGTRLKADYAALVQLETGYGSDRRFTSQEQADLARRYESLTNVLASGSYTDGGTVTLTAVADGRTEFTRRVDTAVAARRLSRTQGTRLKSDYSAVVQVETGYARDGMISAAEQSDLDTRLDALDRQLGDTNYAAVVTTKSRLDAIARALPASGLARAAQAQLRTEHEDLTRLDAAYARLDASADDTAYLDRRLTDLETRARVKR